MNKNSIAIVDYGMGNLRSVQKGFLNVGHDAFITGESDKIKNCSALVLPGVGSFPDCMKNLENLSLIAPIKDHIKSGKPFLGICLGFQLLFTESEEFGICKGLDIISGRVKRFKLQDKSLKIPHMGWNNIKTSKDSPILRNIPNDSHFYFVHSFYVEPEDENIISTKTEYEINFCSGICLDNIFAFQFHPEKSQKNGLNLLKNFGDLI